MCIARKDPRNPHTVRPARRTGIRTVCVEANARNSYGGYTGLHRTIAVFSEKGGFDTMDGGILGFDEYCGDLPFPELNGQQARR